MPNRLSQNTSGWIHPPPRACGSSVRRGTRCKIPVRMDLPDPTVPRPGAEKPNAGRAGHNREWPMPGPPKIDPPTQSKDCRHQWSGRLARECGRIRATRPSARGKCHPGDPCCLDTHSRTHPARIARCDDSPDSRRRQARTSRSHGESPINGPPNHTPDPVLACAECGCDDLSRSVGQSVTDPCEETRPDDRWAPHGLIGRVIRRLQRRLIQNAI